MLSKLTDSNDYLNITQLKQVQEIYSNIMNQPQIVERFRRDDTFIKNFLQTQSNILKSQRYLVDQGTHKLRDANINLAEINQNLRSVLTRFEPIISKGLLEGE